MDTKAFRLPAKEAVGLLAAQLVARELFMRGSLSSICTGTNAGAGSWPRPTGRGEGEEGDGEEEPPDPVVFGERWITGLLFWGATTELCAEMTFARGQGYCLCFCKKKKKCSLFFRVSLLSWRAIMSCFLCCPCRLLCPLSNARK